MNQESASDRGSQQSRGAPLPPGTATTIKLLNGPIGAAPNPETGRHTLLAQVTHPADNGEDLSSPVSARRRGVL
jgi:hypothetical protein